jgi:hypothetical protein
MKGKFLAGAIASVCAIGFGTTAATAATETEPNDTLATAQFVANTGGSLVIVGQRSFADPSDDFFSFDVFATGVLSISSASSDGAADSILGLYNAGGTLVASNDDGASGSMSAINFNVPNGMTGRYSIGFSGYNPGLLACTDAVTSCYDTTGDFVFDTFVAGGGAGGSTGWDYQIDISGVALVPEPGIYLMFGLGLPLLLGLKRRSRSLAT